jgi:beta-lactamase superfamily II metal-dependent hydrolase
VTFTKGEGMVHLAYSESTKDLVVTADMMASDLYTKPAAGSWEVKQEKSSFAVMTMDYSKYSCGLGCNPIYDNNGLSYVVTLQDGRYIVYDGGYESPNDSEILYEFLRDNNKREGKPVIAAWVLTHSHGDHFGAFISFTAKHAADVTVENFVLNTGTSTCYTGGHDSTLESIGAYAKTYYGGAKVHQPHIGQRLYFCDVEMEILYTHEMFHFSGSNLTNENSASLVTRLWIDGVSILLTADAADNTNLAMARLYGDYLKSDFFQVPHHGNGGGREELYRLVRPTYALWTTSQPGFRRRTFGNSYSVGMPSAYIARLNKKIFEDVGGTRESINENGAINNWCADGPVDILTFGPNKTVNVTYYQIREELLPRNVIEPWDAEFSADPRQ